MCHCVIKIWYPIGILSFLFHLVFFLSTLRHPFICLFQLIVTVINTYIARMRVQWFADPDKYRPFCSLVFWLMVLGNARHVLKETKPSPNSARLLKAKSDDHIKAAYVVPKEERFPHVLLGYEPTYTSYL